jgi:hypothetical protein
MPFNTGGPMISAAAAADPPDYGCARAVARFDKVMRELVHALNATTATMRVVCSVACSPRRALSFLPTPT